MYHHRASSSLKQQNKKHKGGKARRVLGRVADKASPKKGSQPASKAARVNRAKQLQRQARQALKEQRRAAGVEKVVAVVALSERVDAANVARRLAGVLEDDDAAMRGGAWCAARTDELRFLVAAHGDVGGAIDAASLADCVVFAMAYPPEDFDDASVASAKTGLTTASVRQQSLEDACSVPAQRVVSAIKAMGMPPAAGVLVTEEVSDGKRGARRTKAAQRLARRYFGSEFGDKVPWQRDSEDALRLVQSVLGKNKEPAWRAPRASVIADSAQVRDDVLVVRGWVRVADLSLKRLMHVPGAGALRLASVDVMARPGAPRQSKINTSDVEPLEMRAEPDPLAGDQTWPDEDEDIEDAPKLTSDYQAAWGLDDDDELSLDEDLNASASERKRQRLQEEMEFPDEVDAPDDRQASERFARYRPLANLRDAEWDPYESLPRDYARVHALPSYDAARKAALNLRDADAVPVGSYVVARLAGSDPARLEAGALELRRRLGAVACVSLLRHENRLSVLHFMVRRVDDDDNEPVASKEPLEVRVGRRSWLARPLFAQPALKGKTHKFERFLRPGDYALCTVYGPVTFGPHPVFLFRRGRLVAAGTVYVADPTRCILKRVVLTGLPVRTHKRKAVIKHMFNNPDDVRFFKPAQLHTKHGLLANITEPLGTHGLFKIGTNKPMKQNDTILLPLCKRVYPKFVQPDHLFKGRDDNDDDAPINLDDVDLSTHFAVY